MVSRNLGCRLALEVGHDSVHESLPLGRDVLIVVLGQLTQEFLLPFAELFRDFDEGLNQQIPLGPRVRIRHALPAQPIDGAALSARRNIEGFATIEGGNFDGRAERGLAKRDRQLKD